MQDSFYIKRMWSHPLISSLNLTNMKRTSKKNTPPVMINGMLTITQSDSGLKIIDFTSLEAVEVPPFKVMCLVQAMRNGDVFITETVTLPSPKRNPHLFVGKFITITRRDDGSLRLNFRPVDMKHDFCASEYASHVANELFWALTSLLEK